MQSSDSANVTTAEQRAYGYWLSNLPGIGDKTILRLLAVHGDPGEIYERLKSAVKADKVPQQYEGILTLKQLQAVRAGIGDWDVKGQYDRLKQQQIQFFTIDCEQYPRRLKNIPDPPYGIYVKGQVPAEGILSVAIIGARECSEYGRYVGQALGKALGRSSVQVISGMARGIDGISQEAALAAGGSSFGVLGCGVDVCYPAGNRALYAGLLEQGGILSTYPPGTLPKARYFPPRNRIVSGLSDVVIVVEARQKSGTLITVDMALEQGREVYVVPGRLTDRLSDGCNKLLKQGAGIILSPEEFLREMNELFPGMVPGRQWNSNGEGPNVRDSGEDIDPSGAQGCHSSKAQRWDGAGDALTEPLERKVYGGIDLYPRSIEQIREAAGLDIPYHQMQQILMKLCLTPYVRQVSPGFYQKNASATGF